MLFRLLALWICLMTTSLHAVGARAVAMANGIERRMRATYTDGKAYSILTDQLGTPTEAYNAKGEEVWSRRLDTNGNIFEEKYNQYAPYSDQIWIPFLFQGQFYIKPRTQCYTE